jgi:hypothetical protein
MKHFANTKDLKKRQIIKAACMEDRDFLKDNLVNCYPDYHKYSMLGSTRYDSFNYLYMIGIN